jgi:hypothetical protein
MADFVKGLFGGASSVSSALPSDAGKKQKAQSKRPSKTAHWTDIGTI